MMPHLSTCGWPFESFKSRRYTQQKITFEKVGNKWRLQMASESNDENDTIQRGAGEDEKATRLIASALESPKVVAHAALLRGKEALEQIITENSDSPNYAYVREARRMFRLVLSLDPSNEDVHKQMARLDKMTDALPPPKAPPPNMMRRLMSSSLVLVPLESVLRSH